MSLLKILGKKLKTQKSFAIKFYSALAMFLLSIILIIALVSCGSDDEESAQEDTTPQQEEVVAQEDAVAENVTPSVNYSIPDVALEENVYPEVNNLVNQYFNAMTNGDIATIASLRDEISQEELIKIEKESVYIDEFDNLKVYTKPGPMSGSYVVFVYYEIKFSNITTLAPGLTTLYVCPKEDGSLYICDANMTEQDTEYVKGIVAQTDVADLFSLVETKYGEALDADADLKNFMGGLSAKLEEEVSQAMAQLQPQEAPQPEEEATQPTEEASQAFVQELVKATDTVNVRASDSENADKIGRIALGETITRYEARENGWSKVDYNGTEGYIKSEYLEVVQSEQTQTEEAANQEEAQQNENQQAETQQEETQQEETQQEDAPATNLTAKGKVTIKETVNVRKSASTSADKLGVAYQGETYELIMEQADGWCKIKFNGQTGYVKTEFVE